MENPVKKRFEVIFELARPYLNTRKNDVHTEISLKFAQELVEREGGNEGIVIPAVILHDVGWKTVPPDLQIKAFGPGASSPELNRTHEVEGVRIAGEILRSLEYREKDIRKILKIIDGHDSRKEALFLEDRIVKDSDKLWRYTRTGFRIDIERFGETPGEGLSRLGTHLKEWFFTDSAKKLAEEELENRNLES